MELTTFRLRDGVDEAEFLRADAAAQAFFHRQPGILRRTTARDIDTDEWLVAILWASWEHADAAGDAAKANEAMQSYQSMIDPASVRVRRYQSLGG